MTVKAKSEWLWRLEFEFKTKVCFVILQEKINLRNIQKYIHCHLEADLKIRHWKRHPVAHEVHPGANESDHQMSPKSTSKSIRPPNKPFFCFMDAFYSHPFLAQASAEDLPMWDEEKPTPPSLQMWPQSGRMLCLLPPEFNAQGFVWKSAHSRPWFRGHMPVVSWCVRHHTPVPL